MNQIQVTGVDVVIVAIAVLWVGNRITQAVSMLKKYSIPIAVTGGLLCSLAVAAVRAIGGPEIVFEMATRDTLLMVFFTTIGISAKFGRLAAGGKSLGVMVLCAGVFLVIQDFIGVMVASAMGSHPAYGLFAGSVSLAGGHGTAIAWGKEAEAAGLPNADLIGIAFATFGLVAGGVIGGPVAEWLIKRNHLEPKNTTEEASIAEESESSEPYSLNLALRVMLILALCLSFGEVVNAWLFSNDIKLPGFLTAMMVGIVITNLSDRFGKPLPLTYFDYVGEVALQLFLAMSLMSMDLSSLASSFGTIIFVLVIQVLVIALFGILVIFRAMGKDYDAAVIVGGFCGLGMGATPVAIANMSAVTRKYGPSFKAFLVVPLVGAFFIDVLNAMVIKFFVGLPIMQQTL
ncbi:Sodium/glutamate symport carrier protein [Thalassoglobus neptunius]|uniref:Sodium/glutamate symporter n=1 Tax=Thalassoglobus neptunius TaxID=1938619 RepID=A0A5C5X633_9PLAN|nr:sodium/glutamate symporter [Thalassoglobus neptunius]TWT57791.1 Sodium/glutamate symport carrier protein [Thalassoglobus neptunius]